MGLPFLFAFSLPDTSRNSDLGGLALPGQHGWELTLDTVTRPGQAGARGSQS